MTDSHIRWPDGYNPLGHNGPAQPVILTEVPDGQGGVMTVIHPISLQAGLKTYIASIMDSTSAANKFHLLLFNGTPALGQPDSKIVRVWDIKANANITAAVAGTSIVLNASRISDIGTVGANQNIKKTDTTDGNLPAEIVARSNVTNPTITTQALASATVLIEEAQGTEGRVTIYKSDSAIAPIVCNPGQGLVIQQGTFAGIGSVNIHMYFTVDTGT